MSGKADSGTAYQHPLLPAELQAEYRRRGDWQGITLAQIVEQRAAEHPDRPAVVGPHPLTYGDLWEQARRVAGALEDGGLKPGEFLVSVMSNCVEGLVLEVAASITALTYAPRSAQLSPAEAINLFAQLDARGLILQRSMLERDGWSEAFEQLRKRLQDRPVWIHGETVDGLPTLAQAIESGRAIDPVEQEPAQPCLVLATGGTTGMPKSVLHSSETLVYAARNFGRAINYSADDVHVAIAPYGHAGGSVFEMYMPLLHGAAVLPIARWKPRDVAETIARYGGTFFIAMGTHVYDLLALEPSAAPQLRSIRCIATGAGPQEIFVKCDEELMPVVRVYGLSEAVGHALGRLDDPASVRVLQDGVPFDGMDWRIVDTTTGDRVPPGTIGEYQCRGPNMFMGYYGQDDVTAKALTDDGYYRTGDLMVLSDEGYVSWTGRTKDIIRRGGLQIDPIEIEGMLSRHPQIKTVAVVGQPDMRLGERAVIVAVPASGERAELSELCAYLQREGLPKQSLPERLVYVDDLPRTGVGKVHRVRVKDMILEEMNT
jgi:acyl-CoA synthetase (AMP-forming)/AMP-acid ligase II